MRKTANSIHHTHWDLIWYFTAQDATIQLAYNMKELLTGFKEGKINNFYFCAFFHSAGLIPTCFLNIFENVKLSEYPQRIAVSPTE